MCDADVGDDGEVGLGDGGEGGDFTGGVGANFDDEVVVGGGCGEEGEGDASKSAFRFTPLDLGQTQPSSLS